MGYTIRRAESNDYDGLCRVLAQADHLHADDPQRCRRQALSVCRPEPVVLH